MVYNLIWSTQEITKFLENDDEEDQSWLCTKISPENLFENFPLNKYLFEVFYDISGSEVYSEPCQEPTWHLPAQR